LKKRITIFSVTIVMITLLGIQFSANPVSGSTKPSESIFNTALSASSVDTGTTMPQNKNVSSILRNELGPIPAFSYDEALTPVVTSVTPDNGTTADNALPVTITGDGFIDGAAVKLARISEIDIFGDNVVLVSNTSITCCFNLIGASGGAWDVVVTNDTQSGILSNGFTISETEPIAPPTVTSVTPDKGTTADSILAVSIGGTDFSGDAGLAVEINHDGAAAIPASNINWINATLINCTFDLSGISADLGEKWDIKVTNPDSQTGTGNDLFSIYRPHPTVSSITPDSGINTGPVHITGLTGSNFVNGQTSVKLSQSGQPDVNASGTAVDGTTRIVADLDLTGKASGSWDVVVTVTGAEFPATLAGGFTVNNPVPVATSITPATRTAGDPGFDLNVNGSGFIQTSVVRLNGISKNTTFVSNTQLRATVPASDLLAAGTFNITVFNPGPGGGTSNSRTFTVNPPSEFKMSIPNADHNSYGFTYPVTYAFSIPGNSQGLVACKKNSAGGDWLTITEKSDSQLFSGIEAARFDYPHNKAYISLPFPENSNDMYVKITDQTGAGVPISYLGIPDYYDNRRVAVTITIDDIGSSGQWGGANNVEFARASQAFADAQVWWTPAILTHGTTVDWAAYQAGVNRGFLEVAAHSRTHDDPPYSNYDSEIGGSKADIINNLALPFARGSQEYVWCWIEPDGGWDETISQKLGEYEYLVPRYAIEIVPNGPVPWYPWDDLDKHFQHDGMIVTSAYLDFNTNTYLNPLFDEIYADGGTYHLWGHIGQHTWLPGDIAYEHIQHIKGKTDVWYAGFGQMYMYRYAQKVVTVSQPPSTSPLLRYTLNISVSGQGTTNPAPGTSTISNGASVSITATANNGYKFDHWAGDISGAENPVNFPGSSNMSVQSVFTRVEQVLTRIAITPANRSLTANQTQVYTAQGFDQYDNVINGLNFTWSVTNLAAGLITPSGLFTAGTATGSYADVIQAACSGKTGAASVTISGGLPAKIVFTTAAQNNITAGSVSEILSIQIQDNAGNPTNVAGTTAVALTSSSSASGKFDSIPSGPFSTTEVSLAAGSSTASFYYKDTCAGTPTVTAHVSGLADGTQQEMIVAGPLDHIAINPSNHTLALGGTQLYTAQGLDQYDNIVTGLDFTWSVTNPAVGSITPSGLFTAGTAIGSYADAIQAACGSITGSTGVTILDTTVDHYIVSPINSPEVVSAPFSLTIQAQDQYNNNLTNVSETVNLTFINPDPGAQPLSVIIADGKATIDNMTFTVAQTGQAITCTGATSGKTGASNAFDIIISPVSGGGDSGGGGGGGGGGGSSMGKFYPGGLLIRTPIDINLSNGVVPTTANLTTQDGQVVLNIAAQTRLLTREGNALSIMTAENMVSAPSPSSSNGIIMAYTFGPDGAIFDPGLNLIMGYDPIDLPKDANERSLYIGYWTGTDWQPLSSTVDIQNKTVTVKITGFSTYALLYVLPIPASFKLSGLKISPTEARIGDEISITAAVTNDGGTAGKHTLYLKINDVQIVSQEISLEPGASQTVQFSFDADTARNYTADINGQTVQYIVKEPVGQFVGLTSSPTASVTAEAPSVPSSQISSPTNSEENKATSISLWVIILGVSITALILAVLIVMLRKRTSGSE
jgi:hypothetical protein